MKTIGYAAKHSISELRPMQIERRAPDRGEVSIDILFCGVCHSDVHQVKNEWKNTIYPCMPGHEIVGRVAQVGKGVTKYSVGDRVGVGCMVDACLTCDACQAGLENYCEQGFLGTYNGNQRHPSEENLTYGGYSERITVREEFVLRIPESLSPSGAAPLLCAGVTTYSPMKRWGVEKGTRVGVAGFGGLGQMALKIAKAMGAEVTVITGHADKVAEAKRLEADHVVLCFDDKQMKAAARSLDLILSTLPQAHDPNPYMTLLARDGTYVVVGCLVPMEKPLDCSKLNIDRKNVGTTLIGGIAETQELIDFCAQHRIVSGTKIISIDELNEAFKRLDAGEVAYRYVIDMASLAGKTEDKSVMAKIGL